uniref:GCN5-related N-acetyltransferase Rv2170-like domain-containing protein n=1 Tax=Amphimedon queenslandica TaxID=400682 RepID=A0A1X7UK66_AMPQE
MEKLTAIEVVDDSKREELKDFLYKHWPDTIEIIRRLKLAKELNAKVFTDSSWPDVNTVIYTYNEGEITFIYTFGTDDSKTAAAIVKSVIDSHLDKAQQPLIMGCEEVLQEINKLGMNQKFSTPSFRYVYKQNNTRINRPALPEGYIIDSIHSSDVEYVVSKWEPAKDSPKMKQLMRHFIANYPNTAIYDTLTEPPRPVSWNVSSGLGIIFHLFTDEEHRRKGLAFMVITEMTQKILAKGITPVGYVFIDNIKGQRFFEFSGYTNTGSLVAHKKF